MAVPRCSLFCLLVIFYVSSIYGYEPTWESLDSRPIPEWYDEAKLGIFIHWGVFSVPSFASEWFWWDWKGQSTPAVVEFMAKNYPPDFTYADFAKQFTAEFFNAVEWAQMFQSSGAKYIVFVSKHHEGFTNWPSAHSFNWNSMQVGPHRDIVGELMNATRSNTDLKFGLYHSLFEWFNPLYLQDKKANFTTQNFVKFKTMPELYELVNNYEPEIVWSDGAHGPVDYWQSREFLAWLYTNSTVKDTVVTNDRWATGTLCHHGGFYTCSDRYNPGFLQKHKWENAMTIDRKSWGFRRTARLSDYLTMEEILQTFVETVSCGGNMLMNVGPPHHGHITPVYEERLRNMGKWLKVNGEGIYKSKPWTYQNDTLTKGVWYTKNNSSGSTTVYAFVFNWPGELLSLGLPLVSEVSKINLVGDSTFLDYKPRSTKGVDITIPLYSVNELPCQWLWAFKITAVEN
ncbi:alpha-L-fucosidase [Aplysia californica]|uniref:alpha-L-fucosidase n=1 Tax=Aplysia californica TaxID=6500 RepID=A0ABM0JVW7_APLCA|nr:alpha-L-fucosidase [Aplysia californica]